MNLRVSAVWLSLLGGCLNPVSETGPQDGGLDAGQFRLDGGACAPGASGGAPYLLTRTLPVASPIYLAKGDFNRDGKMDLVAANEVANTVTVLLGNGDLTFGVPLALSVGQKPVEVLVADLDGDGKLDLLVTNNLSDSLSVLLGHGDGTFESQQTFPVGGWPQGTGVGDFNADGQLDVAVGNVRDDNVSVLTGNRSTGFDSQRTWPAGAQAVSVAVADFNGDGKPDLAVTNPSRLDGTGTVSLLLGRGDGTFQAQRTFATGNVHPIGCYVADFNRDGKPDVATVSQFSSRSVSILMGDGVGGLLSARTFPVGSDSRLFAVGDLDGDGKTDLAVPNFADATVSLLRGNGDGTFQAQRLLTAGAGAASVVIADFDGDCAPDLVVANRTAGSLSVFRAVP